MREGWGKKLPSSLHSKDRSPETQKIGSQDLEQSLLGAGEVLPCAAIDKARWT